MFNVFFFDKWVFQIDFVITSGDLVKHIEHVHIDDKRKNVLTKLYKPKGKKKKR